LRLGLVRRNPGRPLIFLPGGCLNLGLNGGPNFPHTEAFSHADRGVAKRAFDAMMTMRKIDIAAIEAAVRG